MDFLRHSFLHIFRRIPYGLAIIFFLACQSIDRRDLVNPLPEKRRSYEEIEISYDIPQEKHVLLSEVILSYNTGYERERIFQKLKKMAAESGADGIYILPLRQKTHDMLIYGGMPNYRLREERYELKAFFYRLIP
ncbi:MAG: hypothetical protein NZM25_02760 [Leptospiraceae bacterium]|nr:hypothetical protein [Leptospiraceae bacterium]MDW8307189.1 hypothetical protein [Leptospiraceae bacterium]